MKPTILTLLDMAARFDKLRLSDTESDVIEFGADLRAVKIIRKLSDRMKISIKGDPQNQGQKRCRGLEDKVQIMHPKMPH